jgi:hypothetical protein
MQRNQPLRPLVFLNHATPEDNQFTAWLAAKLTVAGYEVWCDFHRLKGGQDFWKEIEEVIRNRTARFIAITSRVGQDKDGVRNELSVALAIERDIPDFVIPVRIDDLPFKEFKITVHKKNAIDFYGNWENGLRALLKSLEHYKVPRKPEVNLALALPWLVPKEQLAIQLRPQTESLETNAIEIRNLPDVLSTVEVLNTTDQVERTEANSRIPWFQHRQLLCGFASQEELQANFATSNSTKKASRVLLDVFLKADSKAFVGLKRDDASRLLIRLLRQAWGLRMQQLGLKPFTVGGKLLGWFVPNGLLPANKQNFREHSGKKRTKNLVGRSDKRGVYWHFGVSAYPSLLQPPRFELRTHVLFSEDGQTPLESVKRMHRLRRGFCRNWWNDHFRSLFRAVLAYIAQDEETIVLPAGASAQIVLSSSPIMWTSPVSLSDSQDLPEELISELDEEAEPDDLEDEEEAGVELEAEDSEALEPPTAIKPAVESQIDIKSSEHPYGS